jgi:ankyrin repeat protein
MMAVWARHREELNKKEFSASPLHLACLERRSVPGAKNFQRHAKPNSPDASGLFPIHLAAAVDHATDVLRLEEDLQRLECVKLLLKAGVP